MTDLDTILGDLAADDRLWPDFLALCDCGGRRAGTAGEEAALQFVHRQLAAIAPTVRSEPVAYAGWRVREARLALDDGTVLACHALLGSQSTPARGLDLEVIDLGRGTSEDFERHAQEIRGRMVLVRHEYPFSAIHIHRRRKYGWAMEHGAAAFVIANPHRGCGPVGGSSGRGGGAGIPAVGTDFESAEALHRARRAHLTLLGEDYAAHTSVLMIDLPGRTSTSVALSAHVDGHDLGESAMDNASGVATLLTLARAFAPHVAQCMHGLKVCIFSAEEWALAGSRQFLDAMSPAERDAILLNVNLDTVAGDDRLTALTSEFGGLDGFARSSAADAGITLGVYRPMMANSDHYNFARHGIAALRLVAGFDRPESRIRHILTPGDTREKVEPGELRAAGRAAAAIVWRALNATESDLRELAVR